MNRRKNKVLFLVNIPSPYRVCFFNELGKLCDLTVLFEKHLMNENQPGLTINLLILRLFF